MSDWSVIIPEATKNLIANPVFLLGVAGWGGVGTPTQSSERYIVGPYSAVLTAGAATRTVWNGTHVLADGETITGSIKIWLDATVTGSIVLRDNTTPANSISSSSFHLLPRQEWLTIGLTRTNNTGGPIDIQFWVQNTRTDSSSQVWFDAVQLEKKAYPTTLCYGDLPGCRWLAAPHASYSVREEFEPSGGIVKDLENDLGWLISGYAGVGTPPFFIGRQDQPLLPGRLLQTIGIEDRHFVIRGLLENEDSGKPTFHNRRQALIKALSHFPAAINSRPPKRRIFYSGAAVTKYIDAVLEGGLELGRKIGPTEEPTLQFYADNPMFYEEHDSGVPLTGSDTATLNLLAGRQAGLWSNMGFGTSGGLTQVRALQVINGILYVGGSFTDLNGSGSSDNIAKIDLQTGVISPMGTGVNGEVHCMARGPDGYLYIGGAFTLAGGVANTARIARWTGSAFQALGTGVGNGIVRAMAFDTNGRLWITGSFTAAGGIAAGQFASWQGAWTSEGGDALNGGDGHALVTDNIGNVYIGGDIAFVGDGPQFFAGGIVRWNSDTSTWYNMQGGLNADVFALLLVDGSLYLGGNFTDRFGFGSSTLVGFCRWNGAGYEPLSGGVLGVVRSLAMDSRGQIWLGGGLTTGGHTSSTGILIWSGLSYKRPSLHIEGLGPVVYGLYITDYDDVFVGGNFVGVTGHFAALTSIPYTGTAPAYPVIRLVNSGSTNVELRELTNHTTGARLELHRVVPGGDTLTINAKPHERIIKSEFLGDLFEGFGEIQDLSEFYLVPGNGAVPQNNDMLVYVHDLEAGTWALTVSWRPTYISID